MEILLVLGLLLALYVAWSIGANDETMATLAGSGFTSIALAALLGALMDFLGAVFLGYTVEETLGKKLIKGILTTTDVVILLLAVATWLIVASYRGWPVSTTHSVVGAAIGLGILKYGLSGVSWNSFLRVLSGWMISPVTGLLGSVIVYAIARKAVRKSVHGFSGIIKVSKYSSVLLIAFSSVTAFFRGANDIANATAFLSTLVGQPLLIRGVCGAGMALGLLILGRRVIKSVGVQLVELDPLAALCIQISTTLTMGIGTILGLPLSGTHVLVSAVIGIGIVRRAWINVRGLGEIFLTWAITFPCSAALAVAFSLFLLTLML
ncbi:MAG: hypothetical protein DRJ59_05755 [Thermoprotei archaeon]|nr:MAG: hypothetical protein DRJ59_05755 [Thermoprotei archaeon]